MRWNIPALYAGIVENVQVLRPQVNHHLANYYEAIGKLIRRKNPTPKPLLKFAGDVLIIGGKRFALETEPETILKLFEDVHTAALLERPVYDMYHDEWVEVDLFSNKNEDYLIVGGVEKLREDYMDALGDISLAADFQSDGGYDSND
jgi:hypothetical protein